MRLRFEAKCEYGKEALHVGASVVRFAGAIWCIEHYREWRRTRG